MNFKQQVIGYAQVFSLRVQLVLGHTLDFTDLTVDQTHMTNSFYDVACSWLTLRTNHRSAFAYTT
ncbi:hypothetical protein D3C71_1990400 [compost metagenome]